MIYHTVAAEVVYVGSLHDQVLEIALRLHEGHYSVVDWYTNGPLTVAGCKALPPPEAATGTRWPLDGGGKTPTTTPRSPVMAPDRSICT